MPYITEMTSRQARAFLLKSSSYCSIDLPPYFDFRPILMAINKIITDKPIRDFTKTPSKIEKVNYKIISNKDGELGWRPFEIIHPLLYVRLVRIITSPDNWRFIQSRFKSYSNTVVQCKSIPFHSDEKQKDKAAQIMNWWTGYEQASLEESLEYEYMYEADVSDCYGSIYTHSIAWSLHTKSTAKERRNEKLLLGNQIDTIIQDMRYGQTNGIPQGSTLMDFIAEIVLGYTDELLTEQLQLHGVSNVKILRYRDDYRIFSNSPVVAKEALKHLSIILSDFGMKLNTAKTKVQHDLVKGSVKPDKHALLQLPKSPKSLQKELFSIYNFSTDYPNSGSLLRLLSEYHGKLVKQKTLGKYDNPIAMISILVNMAAKNPKAYSWIMIIIDFIVDLQDVSTQIQLARKIKSRLDKTPHTGILDIWMQRIFFRNDPDAQYKEGSLTAIVSADNYPTNPNNSHIWDMSWINNRNLKNKLLKTWIINIEQKAKINNRSNSSEVNIFEY